MAKIEKIKKGTATIYPATIPQAVVDPESGKSARTELDEKANHGYEENPKTLKEVDDEVSQLAGDVGLLDAVHSDKIKDIENVISTMNLNQSAQLSVSGRKTISLPKNASNGGMQVKLEGLTAENLVANGNFSNGLNGWGSAGQGTASVSNNLATLTGTGTGSINFLQNTEHKASPNDKMYLKAKRKLEGGGVLFARYESRSGGEANAVMISSLLGEYSYDSVLVTLREGFAEGKLRFVYQHYFATGESNLGASSEIGNIVVVNLTKTFGAGNEPTKEQCDLIFSDYFEGVKSFVPTGRVRSDIGGRNLITGSKEFKGFYITDQSVEPERYKGFKVYSSKGSCKKLLQNVSVSKGIYTFSCYAKLDETSIKNVAFYTYPSSLNSKITNIKIGNLKEGWRRVSCTVEVDEDIQKGSTIEEGFSIRLEGWSSDADDYKLYQCAHKLEKGNKATDWTPAPEDVLAGTVKGTGTSLYLTAPELCSNGAVKDEIRKGANGYELVKRVGVGTLGSELITNAAIREFSSDTGWWIKQSGSVITDGVGRFTGTGFLSSTSANHRFEKTGVCKFRTIYKLTFRARKISGTSSSLYCGNGYGNKIVTVDSDLWNAYSVYYETGGDTGMSGIAFGGSIDSIFEIDDVSLREVVGSTSDNFYTNLSVQELSDGTVLFALTTPVITPISYGGILNSAENGTVYHEPVIADAGVYGTNMAILLTDYPISAIEEIIKYENEVDTYLNVASAAIAPDGLSFTHPDLASGDLVLFTYAFDKESTNGNITATFYDSNVVKIDTVTGKAYKIEDVVTNGVLTRTLTEV